MRDSNDNSVLLYLYLYMFVLSFVGRLLYFAKESL